MTFAHVLFLLVFAHFLADYPLQGQFLADSKNHNTDIGKLFWPHALAAHSIIQGGFVFLITGSLVLGIAEVVIHGATDWFKCEGKISLNVDLAIHLACKMLWTAISVWWMV